jgi:hypothetical protein
MIRNLRIILALLCLGWPAASQAQAIKEVAVDLSAHTFVQVLPFDVPFLITGEAPAGTRQVRVSIVDSQTLRAGPVVSFPWDADEISDKAATFRLLIPRLDAEKFYRFSFDFRRALGQPETDAIRKSAVPALEGVMRTLTLENGQLAAAASASLRERLTSALEQTIGNSRQVIVDGTLFDRKTPHEDVLNQFNVAGAAIIGPQEDRSDVVEGYTARQALARPPIDTIRADAALRRVIGVIEASTDLTIVTALGQWRAGFDIARLDDNQAAGRANGTLPLETPKVAFMSVWTGDDVGPYERNYKRTLADLDALRQLLEASLPILTSIPDADRTAIQTLLAAAGPIRSARNQVDALVNLTARMRADLSARDQALTSLSTLVSVEARKVVVVDGTTVADFRTAQSWYIAMDAGFAYYFRIGTMTPYVGANIYFRPVNKDAPLSLVDSFGRRFSLTFGITLNSIEQQGDNGTTVPAASKTRFDLLQNNRSLLLGAGLRVSQSLRVSGGVLVLKEKDTNPLISKQSVATVPYVSFSLDFDVASALKGGLGALFGGSENK